MFFILFKISFIFLLNICHSFNASYLRVSICFNLTSRYFPLIPSPLCHIQYFACPCLVFKDTYQHVWRQKGKTRTSTTKCLNQIENKTVPTNTDPPPEKKIPRSTFAKRLEFISFELTSVQQQFQTQGCGFINFSAAYNKDLRNLKPSHFFLSSL